MEKVLIYNASLARGGAERVSIYLSEYMVNNKIQCNIITEKIEKNEYDVPDGVTRINLPGAKGYFGKIKKLRSILKSERADVLLVMGVSNCIYMIPAALGLKIKIVVSERNDPKHFLGKTVVKYVSRFLMRFANGFVFQTEDAKTFYHKMLRGKGTIIPNPLFTEGLPDVYTGERRKRFVAAGRLHPQKNQAMLIEAFSKIAERHPDFALYIYGEGGLRAELERLVKAKDLCDRVFLPGNIKGVQNEIKDGYAFIMPSDFEGMPNALIEAMAVGLPCISTDCPCGGPRSLISNRENGILVPVGDVSALAEAMSELVENETFARQLGSNATRIRRQLDSSLIGKQWLEYLSSL